MTFSQVMHVQALCGKGQIAAREYASKRESKEEPRWRATIHSEAGAPRPVGLYAPSAFLKFSQGSRMLCFYFVLFSMNYSCTCVCSLLCVNMSMYVPKVHRWKSEGNF